MTTTKTKPWKTPSRRASNQEISLASFKTPHISRMKLPLSQQAPLAAAGGRARVNGAEAPWECTAQAGLQRYLGHEDGARTATVR